MVAVVHRGFLSSRFDRDASKKKGEIKRPRLRVINQKSIFIPLPLFRETKEKMTHEDALERSIRSIVAMLNPGDVKFVA